MRKLHRLHTDTETADKYHAVAEKQIRPEKLQYEDEVFHSRQQHAMRQWAPIYDLCPDSRARIGAPLLPEKVEPSQVEADEDGPATFACLAGLARHPALLKRFVGPHPKTKAEPYVFEFPDTAGHHVPVAVDARVPVRGMAAHSPRRQWWPPLFEKAYAKHKGGYDRIRDLDGGAMLWDLLHRPVHRLPLRPPPGAAHYPRADVRHNFSHPHYWSKLGEELKNATAILVARTVPEPPDNLHKRSYYAVMAVVELEAHSDDPSRTVVVLTRRTTRGRCTPGP